MKMLKKSNSIITMYAHPYIRYCRAKESHFIQMDYHTLLLKMFENIKFNEYEHCCSKNRNTLRKFFIIGRYNHNCYIFNKNQFLINSSSGVR